MRKLLAILFCAFVAQVATAADYYILGWNSTSNRMVILSSASDAGTCVVFKVQTLILGGISYTNLPTTVGDMLKSVYDTDANNVIDDSTKLNGQLASYYVTTNNVVYLLALTNASAGSGITFSIADRVLSIASTLGTMVSSNEIDWTTMPTGLQDGDDNTTYTADGVSIQLVGTQFSHFDTSSQVSLTNTLPVMFTKITLDSYGHITGLGTTSFTETDGVFTTWLGTNTLQTQITTLQTATGTMQTAIGVLQTATGTLNSAVSTLQSETLTNATEGAGIDITKVGRVLTVAHEDTSAQASVDNANGNVIQDATLDTFGHVTALTSYDLDGRYYTEGEIDGFLTVCLTNATQGTGITISGSGRDRTFASTLGTAVASNELDWTSMPAGLQDGDNDTTYTADGTSLDLAGTVFSHHDTSSQANIDGSNGSVIQDIMVDLYGHVTNLAAYDLDNRYFTETESDLRFVALADANYLAAMTSLVEGAGMDVTTNGRIRTVAHEDTSTQASIDGSNGSVIQDVTLDTYGHLTAMSAYDLDGRYYTETECNNTFVTLVDNVYVAAITNSSLVASNAWARHVVGRIDYIYYNTNNSGYYNDAGYVTASILSDTAYGGDWDTDTTHAPSKNAVYDKINGMVANDAFGAGWNNQTTIAPSKDAVYDYMVTLALDANVIIVSNNVNNLCVTDTVTFGDWYPTNGIVGAWVDFGRALTLTKVRTIASGCTGLVDIVRRNLVDGYETYTVLNDDVLAGATEVEDTSWTASGVAVTQRIGVVYSALSSFDETNRITVVVEFTK